MHISDISAIDLQNKYFLSENIRTIRVPFSSRPPIRSTPAPPFLLLQCLIVEIQNDIFNSTVMNLVSNHLNLDKTMTKIWNKIKGNEVLIK